jgi:hypothetical protein
VKRDPKPWSEMTTAEKKALSQQLRQEMRDHPRPPMSPRDAEELVRMLEAEWGGDLRTVEEHFNTRQPHPNPSQGQLAKWVESLPIKPTSFTVTLPPIGSIASSNESAPEKVEHWKYIVTIRAAPAPEGDVIRVMEMTAESAAHARHFAVKMHGAQSTALPADLWVSSRPMETFDEETFCQTGPE